MGNWICQIVLIVEHVITNLLLNCYNKFVIILGKGIRCTKLNFMKIKMESLK